MFFAITRILVIACLFFVAGVMLVKREWQPDWRQDQKVDLLYQQDPGESHTERTGVLPIKIGWKALLPEGERSALAAFSAGQPNTMVSDPLDQLASQVYSSLKAAGDPVYQQALTSTNTTDEYVGKTIRIPGFVVPLSLIEGRKVQQFFLVPYFGACLHYPPPPPNQMIFVDAPEPFALPALFEPVMVQGLLSIEMFEDPLGTSAYLLELHRVESYSGETDDARSHQ